MQNSKIRLEGFVKYLTVCTATDGVKIMLVGDGFGRWYIIKD